MAAKKRIWQPKLFRLGVLLTLFVVVADWAQWLNAPENLLYDRRARYCHEFTPPPSDRIVHIDIDDDSLNEIGHWPWPRQKFAQILDEISRAKPKVIGMDMYFPEPSEDQGVKNDDGTVSIVPHDDIFADAMKRAGNVLLPISVRFEDVEEEDPLLVRVREMLLIKGLEMEQDQVVADLRGAGMKDGELVQQVRRVLPLARKQAVIKRLEEELAAGDFDMKSLRRKLAPRADATGIRTEAAKLLQVCVPEVEAIRAAERFRFPVPPNMALAAAPSENAVNIVKFADVIRFSGFVDLPPSTNDGTVRTVPLLVNYRGEAMPHMALAMACALLDLDPKNIQYANDKIILPAPNRTPISIPVRTEKSITLGHVGAMVDVAYFGRSGQEGWLTTFDFPKYQEPKAHMKIGQFWAILERLKSVRKNNDIADQILKEIAGTFSVPAAVKYVAAIPDTSDTPARLAAIEQTLGDKDLNELLGDTLKKPANELSVEEKASIEPLRRLRDAARENKISQDVLDRDRLALQNQLQGKAVFINWTATGGGDRYPTSLHPNCPGAIIQSTLLSDILTGNLWRRSPHWVTAAITIAIGLLTTLLVALLPPWRALICTAIVMLGYSLINGVILFDYGNVIVGLAGPLLTSALVWSGLTLTNFISEKRERARIRARFTSYVDPALVEFGEQHPELLRLDGQRREMTVVFTDLAGFTTISEKLGESTVGLLNEYFGKMVPVIRENNGYVNKFLGDGVMFFYNAPFENPNHAIDAVQTIINMRKVLADFNVSLQARSLPPVGMRAGMTSGQMIVGDAGSRAEEEKHNANDYTVLGDRVNLAARLEAANKFFGSNLLMIERTRELIGDRFLLRPIGKIVVAGKSEDVMTYEAICNLSEATKNQLLNAEISAKLVESFQAGEFDDCIMLCDELEEKTQDMKFAATYRKLSTKHLTTQFEGVFSGQIVLTEK